MKYRLRPTFKNPSFEFKDELNIMVCPKLSFTVESKGNSHKIRLATFKLNIMNEIFNFLKF